MRDHGLSAQRITTACVTLALGAATPAMTAAAAPATAPAVFPSPASMRLTGPDFALGKAVTLVVVGPVDVASEQVVRDVLRGAGVEQIHTARSPSRKAGAVNVIIGLAGGRAVRQALADAGVALPDKPEGYAVVTRSAQGGGVVVLAGRDDDGLYHAAQTLRQIVRGAQVSSLVLSDHPAMPVRGTIEGFYGKPWTMTQRAAHIGFLARWKANTYIYSPKDDVFAREKWREPYPAQTLSQLGNLARLAKDQHINFVYAVSPGPSICYSDAADLHAIRAKFSALRALGVESFYVAFDDIEYTKWNCPADAAKFGAAGERAAATAQASLLNAVQADLVAAGHGSLIMVPTEYYNTTESPYKAALREALDPRVVVQWTGTDVVPASISVAHAQAATKAFGRRTLLWDNYPVNDFKEAEGRLLMAPYRFRQAGLSSELSGIVANPMNQEASSRPAVAGLLSFAWNDAGYDAQGTWRASARELAGGDAAVTEALLLFFDTQHLAPTFGHLPWQPQAPRLSVLVDQVRSALADGDDAARQAALRALGAHADALAAAPDLIRAGVREPRFVAEVQPWLEATQLWARSLRLTVDGLSAGLQGSAAASAMFDEAHALAGRAAAVQSIPGATRFSGPVKVADGVLDTFARDAPGLVYVPR